MQKMNEPRTDVLFNTCHLRWITTEAVCSVALFIQSAAYARLVLQARKILQAAHFRLLAPEPVGTLVAEDARLVRNMFQAVAAPFAPTVAQIAIVSDAALTPGYAEAPLVRRQQVASSSRRVALIAEWKPLFGPDAGENVRPTLVAFRARPGCCARYTGQVIGMGVSRFVASHSAWRATVSAGTLVLENARLANHVTNRSAGNAFSVSALIRRRALVIEVANGRQVDWYTRVGAQVVVAAASGGTIGQGETWFASTLAMATRTNRTIVRIDYKVQTTQFTSSCGAFAENSNRRVGPREAFVVETSFASTIAAMGARMGRSAIAANQSQVAQQWPNCKNPE